MKCYICGKAIDPNNVFETINLGEGRGVCTSCDHAAVECDRKARWGAEYQEVFGKK